MQTATRELEPREVAALLRALSSAVVAEINALPEEVLAWHPAPGEWCAKECLGHVALLENLTPADLERGGTHDKVGYLKVKDLIHEWVHHDRNHFRQLEANVQAYVWPAMGNCQKFAGE